MGGSPGEVATGPSGLPVADALLPDFAKSLDDLALELTEAGEHDAATAASRAAAEIRRALQAKNPRSDDREARREPAL